MAQGTEGGLLQGARGGGRGAGGLFKCTQNAEQEVTQDRQRAPVRAGPGRWPGPAYILRVSVHAPCPAVPCPRRLFHPVNGDRP